MASDKSISPFLSRALSSNGDSCSEDDDVFLNSRLDVLSRNYHPDRPDDISDPNSTSFLSFIMDHSAIPPVYTPSPKGNENAVIFSVNLCGKYYGEVGLFEPDISILDWLDLNPIFLNLESFDSYTISYGDEEGDKIPIECEEDYQEALKAAKIRASEEEKIALYISRAAVGFPSSLRSLVSSSLRRVNSVGGTKSSVSSQPQKKDVTTSTSFHNLGNEVLDNVVWCTYTISQPDGSQLEELSSPQENYFGENSQTSSRSIYDGLNNPQNQEDIPRCYSNDNLGINDNQDNVNPDSVPTWFSSYMKQFKEDLSLEVSSKIEERFEQAVGSLSATDVETKLRGLLTGYSTELQNKVLCCCKRLPTRPSLDQDDVRDEITKERLRTPVDALNRLDKNDSMEGEGTNNQDYFLQKLLKREQEILDFLDNTNERIKQKIKVNNDYTDSLRSCLTKELAIEERERVLARIEDFRQRQSRTTNDIKMLQQTMEVNNESIARLALQDLVPPKEYDAKFIRDESFVDGSKVSPGMTFRKHWAVQNTGLKPWNKETFLVCHTYNHLKPLKQSVCCPSLMPGEIGTIYADFKAPSTPGIYSTEWRFMQGDKLFGNHLWCSVIVPCNTLLPTDTSMLSNAKRESVVPTEPTKTIPELEELVSPLCKDLGFPMINIKEQCFKQNSNVASQVNEYQILCYFLYVLVITRPDFNVMRKIPFFKAFKKCLLRGSQNDVDNLQILVENNFLESCYRNGLTFEEMLAKYNSVFPREKEPYREEFVNNYLRSKYLNKNFNTERLISSEDEDEEHYREISQNVNNASVKANWENLPSNQEFQNIAKKNADIHLQTSDSYSPLPLVDYLHSVSGAVDSVTCAFTDTGSNYDVSGQSVQSSSPFHFVDSKVEAGVQDSVDESEDEYLDSEDKVDDEYEDDEGTEYEPDDNESVGNVSRGSRSKVMENGVDAIASSDPVEREKYVDEAVVLLDKLIDGLDAELTTEDEDASFKGDSENDAASEREESETNAASEKGDEPEVDALSERDNASDGNVPSEREDSEGNTTDADDEDDDFFRRVEEEDCEHKSSSSSSKYDEYSGTESLSESEDNQRETEISADKVAEKLLDEKPSPPDGTSAIPAAEEHRPIRTVPSGNNDLSAVAQKCPTDAQKINSLHQNYQQNVEVNLDFELISRNPVSNGHETAPVCETMDPLTFQEKHFTISVRLPPDPVQVPDSDDESFDGLVFIRDSDIPSSVPTTEPCSPSNPYHPGAHHLTEDDGDQSVSCSSFSECEDEADRTKEEQADENDSSGMHSETSSSSVLVDGNVSSVYYESNLPDESIQQHFGLGNWDEGKDQLHLLTSPKTPIPAHPLHTP